MFCHFNLDDSAPWALTPALTRRASRWGCHGLGVSCCQPWTLLRLCCQFSLSWTPYFPLSWFTPLFWWRVSSSTRLKKGLGRDILYASKIRMSTCLLDLHLDVFKTFQRWHIQMESMILILLPAQTLLPLLVITPNVLLSRNPEAILDHSVSHPLRI